MLQKETNPNIMLVVADWDKFCSWVNVPKQTIEFCQIRYKKNLPNWINLQVSPVHLTENHLYNKSIVQLWCTFGQLLQERGIGHPNMKLKLKVYKLGFVLVKA